METEVKTEEEKQLYVSADEVTKYLDDMRNVLDAIVKGIDDSKLALIKKCEEQIELEKGEQNDGSKD